MKACPLELQFFMTNKQDTRDFSNGYLQAFDFSREWLTIFSYFRYNSSKVYYFFIAIFRLTSAEYTYILFLYKNI